MDLLTIKPTDPAPISETPRLSVRLLLEPFGSHVVVGDDPHVRGASAEVGS